MLNPNYEKLRAKGLEEKFIKKWFTKSLGIKFQQN